MLIAKDGQLLYANPAACRLLGYATAEDVINDRACLRTASDSLASRCRRPTSPWATGRAITATVQMSIIPWLGGPARQFVLQAVPNRQGSKRLAASGGAAAARTSEAEAGGQSNHPGRRPPVAPSRRNHSAAAARRASRKPTRNLRAILDTAADGIITLDAEARIHTFSAGAEAIFGYRIAEVAGKPFADLLAARKPQDRCAIISRHCRGRALPASSMTGAK